MPMLRRYCMQLAIRLTERLQRLDEELARQAEEEGPAFFSRGV